MKLDRTAVIKSYRLLLKRSPESEEAIQGHLAHKDYFSFLETVASSTEFQNQHRPLIYHHDYRGYTDEENKLLEKYADPHRTSLKGYIVNYFGVKTNKQFLPKEVQAFPDLVEGIPIPMNFLAEAPEWLGVVESLENAKQKFVGFELGAGWGPWCALCGVLCNRLNIPYQLIAVEGDINKTPFIKENFRDNNISEKHYQIINAVVGADDKEIDFPILSDAHKDYGSSVDKKQMKSHGNIVGYKKTKQVTIESLIQNYKKVDLMHIDIQGSEFFAIKHSISALNKKVKYLVIGTHSRFIEGQLFELLWDAGWSLIREKPCLFDHKKSLDAKVDGTQVWRNNI